MRFRQRTELSARRAIGWRVPFVALAAVATVALAATTSDAKSGGFGGGLVSVSTSEPRAPYQPTADYERRPEPGRARLIELVTP